MDVVVEALAVLQPHAAQPLGCMLLPAVQWLGCHGEGDSVKNHTHVLSPPRRWAADVLVHKCLSLGKLDRGETFNARNGLPVIAVRVQHSADGPL